MYRYKFLCMIYAVKLPIRNLAGQGGLFKSKAPVSQLVNAEVNGGNRNAVLPSNYVN